MKSYLDLVSISAGVRKRQNRMSVFCIFLAVLMVTAIFGMADMFVRSQILQTRKEYGNWHIALKNISFAQAEIIAARPEIAAVSPYGALNYQASEDYTLGGRPIVICGSNADYLSQIQPEMITQGAFPQRAEEALVARNAADALGLSLGDEISVNTPEGERRYTISGFLENGSALMSRDVYGLFLSTEAYCALFPAAEGAEPAAYGILFYVRFADTANLQREIAALKLECSLRDEQVATNNALLGLLGQSRDSFMMKIYAAAAFLFVLVLVSGVIMIASSLNSNVAQRIAFFGLMRCIGATPKQVMRIVRKEAFLWCTQAIPLGLASGMVIIWILCAVLRALAPEYFGEIPVFAISVPSIVSGAATGLLTVFFASRAPAKRASAVSPLAAVSGNADDFRPVRRAANTKLFPVEVSLGVHHALSSTKNFLLMVGSFSLSIVLFLAFSVTILFVQHALRPLHPWTADLFAISPGNRCTLAQELVSNLGGHPAVKAVYGRMFAYDLAGSVNGAETCADLISYEEKQFAWAGKYLLEGSASEVQQEENSCLVVYTPQSGIKTGDTLYLTVNGKTAALRVAGILSESPFSGTPGKETVICSESTFRTLTGETGYTILDLQLRRGATEDEVRQLRQYFPSDCTVADERLGNASVRGTYYCMWLFVYGFLVLIAFITVFNVVNSISMSVSARIRQYGALRAIGMSVRQLYRTVFAEAAAYALTGGAVGTSLGLLCNKRLFAMLVSSRWGDAWEIPWPALGCILLLLFASVILAVHGPVRRIRAMSIADTISTD